MNTEVLYVEDDAIQAKLVKPLLEDDGFAVFHVSNGFDALQELQLTRFDIVLTDYYMPNMNGIELIRHIRQKDYDLPVVVMTAANDISLAFTALQSGVTDFVSKDPESNYLNIITPVLNRALNNYRIHLQALTLEKALEYEKNLSHKTLDSLTQGVVVLDQRYSIKYCNSFFRSMFSLQNALFLSGKTLQDLSVVFAGNGVVDGLTNQQEIYSRLIEALIQGGMTLEISMQCGTFFDIKSTALDDTGYALTFSDITHQKQQQFALDRTITYAPVAMIAVNADGKIVLANNKACELVGLSQKTLLNKDVDDLVPEKFRNHHDLIASCFCSLASRCMREGVDLQLLNVHGKEIPVEVSLSEVDVFGQPRVLATIVDISHRKEAERTLLHAHQMTQSIIDSSPFSIAATDVDGMIVAVSPALESLLLYEKNELIKRYYAVDFHEEGELEARASALSDDLNIQVDVGFQVLIEKARRGIVKGQEWTYLRKDGSKVPVNLTVTTLRSVDKTITGFLFVAYDITEQKRANEYIEHIAHHDALTGLPNRILMKDRLSAALMRVKRFGKKVGVLVLDLDHFKRINDSLGHFSGDHLLKTISERLVSVVRESDTVSRMGGDEFVIVLPDLESRHDAEMVCKKIVSLIAKPISVGLNSLNVTSSIGLSIAPDDGGDVEELLKHADIAMYNAKERGRNGYKAFSLHLAKINLEDMAIEQALHQAFSHQQLTLHYQPQVNALTNQVTGFEALIRWFDPERGVIAPDRFIHMAETTGFIITIGEWVLKRACHEINKFRMKSGTDYTVAVNISPRQFEQDDFVKTVDLALKESGLPPKLLKLEITEGVLVADTDNVLSKLRALKAMGVSLAIDDFGTGYSSLSYVSKYPIDAIKIDKAFMDLSEPSNVIIVSAIIAIASGLNLAVTAEGVESLEQVSFVLQKGCCSIQGFYFSKAMPFSELVFSINRIENEKIVRVISNS